MGRPRPVPVAPYCCSTAVAINATCPAACPVRTGCQALFGYQRFAVEKLNYGATALSTDEVIADEVRRIDGSFRGREIPQDGARGGRDLRIHDFGDCPTTRGARLLGAAATRWRRIRRGGSCWTYTHWWERVPRVAWGPDVAVLASVETAEGVERARRRGYPAAILVAEFPDGDRAFHLPGTTARVVPCPAETRGRTCVECRLCLDRDLLSLDIAIAFGPHGPGAGRVRETLVRLRRK